MERLKGQREEEFFHRLNEPYRPPVGINPVPFADIKQSDLLVQQKNGGEGVDGALLLKCSGAVWDVSAAIHQLSPSEQKSLFTVHLTKEQKQAHVKNYVQTALETIDLLTQKVGRVSVSASPMGGLAPLHAIMKAAVDYPHLTEWVDFVPLTLNKPSIYRLINQSQAHVHIDDGAESMTSQASLLYALESQVDNTSSLIEQIRMVRNSLGTCTSPQLHDVYQDLIDRFQDHQVVILPMYMKNHLFKKLLFNEVKSRQNLWSNAQKHILEQEAIIPIGEDSTTVGSMIDHVPCRDMGVNLKSMYDGGINIPTHISDALRRGGLGNAEFRLLASVEPLLFMSPQAKTFTMQRFVDILGERL